MADVGPWRRWSEPGPSVDRALIVAVVVVDIVAQWAARSDAGVQSAPLSVAALVAAAVSATVLGWRRTRPIAVLLASGVAAAVAAGAAPPGLFTQQSGLTIILGCYAVGSWSDRRVASVAVPAAALVLLVLGARDDGSDLVPAAAVGLTAVALPWMAGRAARSRRLYIGEVEQRLAAAEAERDERARRAVLDERTHIARELHDVVAHHVSLIGVQAGAARTALEASPEVTRSALAAIEEASRAAVGEMQTLLGALRAGDDAQPLAPQPGLAQLESLIAGFCAAGLEVHLTAPAERVALTPALELTVYRIVEEALTNVTRHSAASSAEVDVAIDDATVRIAVNDPGPSRTAAGPTGGRGLVGLAERVALFGGQRRVGPTASGGFTVAVTLPRSNA